MRIAVAGGGLAGLAAACDLVDGGHQVTVFERRPWCGGKTYSHRDEETGEEVDNGQHVFMACTTAYIGFLRKLGTLKLTRRQKRLRVRVFDAEGRYGELRANALPAPGHLSLSFARYPHLRFRQRAGIAPVLLRAARMSEQERLSLHGISLGQWLEDNGQDRQTIHDFWDFMLIPTLNCRAHDASATDALFVLRHGFLHSNSASAIGISAVGLSAQHVDPAVEYITARGGCVRTGTTVRAIEGQDGAVCGVTIDDGTFEAFDAVVCALPARQSLDVLPPAVVDGEIGERLRQVRTAQIINLHCWFDRRVADFPFAAFVGNELQWVFNRDVLDERQRSTPGLHHLVVSVSAAQEYMPLTKRQLEERFVPQIRAAIPGARDAGLVRFQAIKEPDATFVPAPGMARVAPATPIAGLVLAGAHTATGWPATMESAVRSGQSASKALAVSFQALERPLQTGRR